MEKVVGKVGWKICVENGVENLVNKLGRKMAWKLCNKFWKNMWKNWVGKVYILQLTAYSKVVDKFWGRIQWLLTKYWPALARLSNIIESLLNGEKLLEKGN